MSWLFSRVLVEEYLVENFSDGEQSAPLSGSHIQQAYCAPDKMTDFSRLSRFGMMFKPLTENRGEELLMLFRAGFHAKTFQPLEKAQGLTENDQECGATWRGWLAKYDPDSCSWRTAQCSLLEDLNESLATLPRSGMTRSGLLWELPMLEQTIRGTEFGLSEKLPTPQSTDYRDKPTSKGWKQKGGVNYSLANPEIQAKWPTPDANCGKRGTQPEWTPKRKSGQTAQYTINQAVRDKQTWPTPRSCSAMAATITPESAWNEKRNPNLETVVGRVMFPTPTCHNSKEGAYPAEYNRKTPTLATPAGGKLNPMWVEWLMGWPLAWTDLKPLVTDKSHCVPQQHGKS
jgi:hypothetical protein